MTLQTWALQVTTRSNDSGVSMAVCLLYERSQSFNWQLAGLIPRQLIDKNNPPRYKHGVHTIAERISDDFGRHARRHYNGHQSLHFGVYAILWGDEYTISNALNIDKNAA